MNVDLYGLATIENELRGKYYQLHVMTMIDPVSGWFEIARIKDIPNIVKCNFFVRLIDSYWVAILKTGRDDWIR